MRVAERGRDGFQRTVDEMLTAYGWRAYGVIDQERYARRTMKGFPDRFCWHPIKRRMLAIEVKGTGGKLSPEQKQYHAELRECGLPVYTFWPETPQEEIEEVLR